MKKTECAIGMVALLLFGFSPCLSIDQKHGSNQGLLKGYASSAGGPYSTLVNVNRISMWISYDGASARNPTTTNAGVTYPRGTSQSIYADGFLWGGLVHDGGSQILRMNGGTYQQGIVGGRIVSKGVAEAASDPTVRIYRIRRDYATADLSQDASELGSDVATVRQQYKTDWLEWPWQKGAPYYDRNHNGIYDPDPNGAVIDSTTDEPGFADADQVVWFVTNDLNAGQSRSFEGSDPIGLEVQTTLWGYARTDQLGNVIFKQFKFIYKGTAGGSGNSRIDSMYVGQWADPDLGDYSDDFEACDTSRDVFSGLGKTTSLGFVYNSSSLDRNYHAFNLSPPSMGYDFFAGPLVASPGDSAVFDLNYRHGYKNLQMTSWIYFAASGVYSDPSFDYVGAGQWYNLLRGLTPVDGSPFLFPEASGSDEQTKFWLSGDPVSGTGNLDGHIDAAGDRRMLLATGPFSMSLGDTQEVVVALVGGLGSDRLSSVSVLRFNDLSAQFAYDNLFVLPKPPPSPKLRIAELDGELVLNWGYDLNAVALTESDNSKGYAFEGYNIYQLPNATATVDQGIKLATFDIANDVVTILDPVFDAASGQILSRPVQVGPNLGLQRYLRVTTDKIRERPLVDGQSYYFAVSAYNNYGGNSAVPVHSLESPLQIIRAVPQSTDPGVRIATRFAQQINLAPKSAHVSGISEILPKLSIIEPNALTGDTYQLTFAVDTLDDIFKWTLTDATTATVKYNSANFGTKVSGDLNDDFKFPIIDGILFEVQEQVPAIKQDATAWVSPNPVWIEGIRYTDPGDLAEAFQGGVTTGVQLGGFYLSHNASSFNPFFSYPVDIRFDAANPQKAYRLRRTGPHSGYMIQSTNGFTDVPFTAWDMRDTSNPRQLTIAWRDQDDDGTWNPAVDDDGLELPFIYDKTYDPTGSQFTSPAVEDECTSGAKADIIYGLSIGVISGHTLSESAGTLRIVPFLHLTPEDKFVFSTSKPTKSVDQAKKDIDKINAFPNPYYGFNRVETDRFHRFVTFNHLPPGDWRIRIVSLNGSIVRYIDPNSENQDALKQFATWDLNNQNGLPVASGIYVAYVEMPSLGVTKTLKVVIIQEKQVLDYY